MQLLLYGRQTYGQGTVANPGHFSINFGLSKHTLQFLQQINVKNVHLVYGAGIWTHDLWNMILLP